MASSSSIGQFNFIRNATSSFDSTLTGSTTTQRQWMRQTYTRMRGYPSFYDQALPWAPPSDFYQDLYALYRDNPTHQAAMQQHPDWVLRDAQGHPLFIPADCNGTTCTQYAADVGNPAYRAFWIAKAQSELAKGYQGLFIDDVNMSMSVSNASYQDVTPIDPRTGQPMTAENWRRYVAEFTESIRAALPSAVIAHNAQWGASESDPYVQREIDSANIIELERGFNDGGLVNGNGMWSYNKLLNHVDWIHSRGKTVIDEPYNLTPAKQEYEMASLYLVKVPGDAIASDFEANPDNWSPVWQTDLGSPQGSRYMWQGLWRRDYSKGFVLTNQPLEPTRTVQLGGTYDRVSGGSVSSVTLGATSGAVLLTRPSGDPVPPPATSGTGDPTAPAPATQSAPPGQAPTSNKKLGRRSGRATAGIGRQPG